MDSQHIVLIGLGVAAPFILLAYKALTRSRGNSKSRRPIRRLDHLGFRR